MPRATDGEGDALAGVIQDGETLTDEFRVGSATVGVTDRRLLVRREEGAPGTRAVDRLNVGEIRERTLADRWRLLSALQWGVLGLGWACRQAVEYVRGQRQVLEVVVAGADPVRLPPPEDPTVPERLRGAVRSGSGDGPA